MLTLEALMLKVAMLGQSHTIAIALKLLPLKIAQKLKNLRLAFVTQKIHDIISKQRNLLLMTQ